MTVETVTPNADQPSELAPPEGFVFNPQLTNSYEEQVRIARVRAEYQAAPVPSMEDVPTLDITPQFNPTGAPAEEIYAVNRVPTRMRKLGMGTHAERMHTDAPIDIWRIVERDRLEDGTGLIASRIQTANSLGDVEGFEPVKHLLSQHDDRVADPEAATPFVSFSSDPQNLAQYVIAKHGFGLKGGRESVVVRVRVNPNRVLTHALNKEPEVLLLGGVAPEEYVEAYSVKDFVERMVPDGEIKTAYEDTIHRDQALGYWAVRS